MQVLQGFARSGKVVISKLVITKLRFWCHLGGLKDLQLGAVHAAFELSCRWGRGLSMGLCCHMRIVRGPERLQEVANLFQMPLLVLEWSSHIQLHVICQLSITALCTPHVHADPCRCITGVWTSEAQTWSL